MKTYVEKTTWDNKTMIEMTDENGVISWIPTDPANSDYQRYLNPEAEQSTPSVIDEPATKSK
jgi:hypothetical protein